MKILSIKSDNIIISDCFKVRYIKFGQRHLPTTERGLYHPGWGDVSGIWIKSHGTGRSIPGKGKCKDMTTGVGNTSPGKTDSE